MGTCLKIVRIYLVFGAIFNMLIGIACFIVATYIKNMVTDLLVVDKLKNSRQTIFTSIYVVGGFAILSCISAIIGFFKGKKCLQAKFVILNFLYFLIFGAIFAFNIYGKSYIDDQLSLDKCTTGPLKEANDLFVNSKKIWCQTVSVQTLSVGCPCNIQDRSQWSTTDQATLLTYNGISSTGTANIANCSQFQSQFGSYLSQINFLKLVEDNFSCTGICEGDIVYYFSDVNRGPPATKQGCFLQIRDKIYNWLKMGYTYSIIAACICLANVIFALIHCCIGNRQEEKNDYNKVHSQV